MTRRIDHIGIAVEDLDQALDVWQDTLGIACHEMKQCIECCIFRDRPFRSFSLAASQEPTHPALPPAGVWHADGCSHACYVKRGLL